MSRFFCKMRLLCCSALVFAMLAKAEAAPPADERASRADSRSEYQRTIEAALDEFQQGNFPEARSLFTQAHALSPNARTYRGLGFVAFELRNYGESVDNLTAALRSSEKPLEGETRRSTEALLARARGMIARVQLEATPRTASVLIDGVPVTLPASRVLVLEVGDHMLELRASGYLPERRSLKIAGGEELTLAVALHEAPASVDARAEAGADAQRSDRRSERPWYKSPWLWTAVAVVVVGAGVGTTLALTMKTKHDGAKPAGTDNTPPDGVVQTLGSW